MNSFSSKLLEDAVNELAKLPGIGRKSALRLALHLLKQHKDDVEIFSRSLMKMRNEIKQCQVCHNISDVDTCEICVNPKRDRSIVCVVEDIRDVMAIENTSQYMGLYHVLGGIISPMEGIGSGDLQIESLISRVKNGDVKEVIMALATTIEGDTTNFYIFKQLKNIEIKITTIARGISIGDELEYADEITLGRSIVNRTLYDSGL